MKQNQSPSEPMLSPVPMICMENVEQTEVSWLWYPYIPFGKLTIFYHIIGHLATKEYGF